MREERRPEAYGFSVWRAERLGLYEVPAKVKLSQNISIVQKSRERYRIKIMGNLYPNNAVEQWEK